MIERKDLEFQKILDIIAKYSAINQTKEEIRNLSVLTEYDKILELLNETEEMRKNIIKYGEVPFGGITDIRAYVNKSSIGGVLTASEVLQILFTIDAYKNINLYYRNLKNAYIEVNYLKKYLDNLIDLSFLSKNIRAIMDDNGVILDSASDLLFQIRRQKKTEKERLKSKLQEVLQSKKDQLTDNIIVIRNDRMCVCVKVDFKNSFKGIIHDESSSGTTVYIEPLSTVEINNKLLSLENKEREEIFKIMRNISGHIGAYKEELLTNYQIYVNLDIISSKAKYAIFNDAIMPVINQDGYINIIKGRHPLIAKDKIVPIDISLGKTYETIIITGPNTGGKTVALKTVGLLTLMMQSGILIPACEGTNLAVFDHIFVDIGDEQSIEQSLSTFSSHLKKIIEIVDNLRINSLVLLDELGSGTDPKEGSSLAIAILNYLRKRGARTIITTHYSELKSLAYKYDDIINASVEFDIETLSPTYKMLLGIPGKSNALEIAKRLGLNQTIIDDAKEDLSFSEDNVNLMISRLTLEGLDLEKRIDEYSKLIEITKKKEEEFEFEKNKLISNKERILEEARNKAQEIYEESTIKAKNIIQRLEKMELEGNIKAHELASIKHDIKNLKNDEEEKILHIDQELSVGDIVLVIPYKLEGEVLKIQKNGYEVKMGSLKSTFKKEDLNFLRKKIVKKEKTKSKMVSNIKKQGKMELDLRGYRYEEAIMELDKFIDQALLSNYHMVYIIHGFGTGAIRDAVREYLKKCKEVESFRYGGEGEGLNGVTVAYFK